MKKLILALGLLMISGFWVLAQDVTVSSRSRAIHIAYSPSTSALIGFQVGLLANSGGIISESSFIQSGGLYLSGRYNNRKMVNLDRLSVDLGVSLQIAEAVYIFIGGGYGEYKYPYKEPTVLADLEIKGFELEGGAIYKLGKITLHAGVSTLKFKHLDLFGGIGYTF
jgi:hypothetical protein